jgi:hypothetical protein
MNSDAKYKIIFEGDVSNGADIFLLLKQFSGFLDKLNIDPVDFFSSSETVIKDSLDYKSAISFKERLEKYGLIAKVLLDQDKAALVLYNDLRSPVSTMSAQKEAKKYFTSNHNLFRYIPQTKLQKLSLCIGYIVLLFAIGVVFAPLFSGISGMKSFQLSLVAGICGGLMIAQGKKKLIEVDKNQVLFSTHVIDGTNWTQLSNNEKNAMTGVLYFTHDGEVLFNPKMNDRIIHCKKEDVISVRLGWRG